MIAARGGSKGLKSKNIRPLCGKPLVTYTIEQALRWGKAAHVVVSTDSPEIAQEAKKCGLDVPFMRPQSLSTDTSEKIPVIRHAWRQAEKIYDEIYDFVIDLDVTAPLRKIADIQGALGIAVAKKSLVVFSVVPASKNPYFNMVEVSESGIAVLSKHLVRPITRRQDAPSVYAMNASIYIYSREFLKEEQYVSLFTKRTYVYLMDEMSGIDIDGEVDFRFVEFLVKEKLWKFDYE